MVHENSTYDIPLRTLCSKDTPNLFVGGRLTDGGHARAPVGVTPCALSSSGPVTSGSAEDWSIACLKMSQLPLRSEEKISVLLSGIQGPGKMSYLESARLRNNFL